MAVTRLWRTTVAPRSRAALASALQMPDGSPCPSSRVQAAAITFSVGRNGFIPLVESVEPDATHAQAAALEIPVTVFAPRQLALVVGEPQAPARVPARVLA